MRFTVLEGVVASDHLVVGIKFETGSAIGQSYRKLTANDNPVTYNSSTLFSFGGAPVLMTGSGASFQLHTKKEFLEGRKRTGGPDNRAPVASSTEEDAAHPVSDGRGSRTTSPGSA